MMYKAPATRRKQDQGGFILLVVFLMAGAVALMLYSQLPRVAFESEREKEQLLIERGEQYIRAIEMYSKDNNGQWPQSIDDLEKGRNKRYLRRRYIDPYTGKDEWRLIHTNGQQLTDSLVEKPPTEGQGSTQNASNAAQQNQQQVNAAVLARPSDLTLPGAQDFNAPSAPQQFQGQQSPVAGFGVPGSGLPPGIPLPGNVQTAGVPGQQPQVPGAFVPQFPGQQFPGQAVPNGVQPGQPQAPGAFVPQFPGQQFPGQTPPNGVQAGQGAPGAFQPQFPGQQFPGQQQGANAPQGQFPNLQPPPGFQYGPNGVLIPAPAGGAPGQQPVATPGVAQGTPNSAGVDAITRLLTTPRTPPAGVNVPTNNSVGGGGLAGVASKHTGPSIKVYKERQKYEEWEFVYTPRQGVGGVGGVGGAQGGQGGPGVPGVPGQPGGRSGGPGPTTGQGGGGFTGSGFGQGSFGQGTSFGQGQQGGRAGQPAPTPGAGAAKGR